MSSRYHQWLAIAQSPRVPRTVGDVPLDMFSSALELANGDIAESANSIVTKLADVVEVFDLPEGTTRSEMFRHANGLGGDLPDEVRELWKEFIAHTQRLGGLDLTSASALFAVDEWLIANTKSEREPLCPPTLETDPLTAQADGHEVTLRSRYWDLPDRIVVLNMARSPDGSWYGAKPPFGLAKATPLPEAFLTLIQKAIPQWQKLAQVAQQMNGHGLA